MPAHMVFRCDGSASIGAGHMMRCLALAETAAGFGFQPSFLSAPGSTGVVGAVVESGFAVQDAVGSGADLIASSLGHADIAVIDGYRFDAAEEAALSRVAAQVVAFEDRPNRQHSADILVDPTPGRFAKAYDRLVSPLTRVLAGSEYAVMRPVWRKARQVGRSKDASRILVSMGATDPVNATAHVVEGIKASGIVAQVDVVLGAAAPHRADVTARLDSRMTLHVDPADMTGLVRGAKLAVGAPGSSSFERAVLGLPSILVQTADNQADIALAFGRSGAADVVALATLEDAAVFGGIIARLLADDGRREVMSAAAALLCDGRGALRLLAMLAGAFKTKDGSTVNLRMAEDSDIEWLLDLQRKPETRRFARNPAVPAGDDHGRWYAQLMDDTERTLLILESTGTRLGFVRLDCRSAAVTANFEVSIAVDPTHHGRGLGFAALQLARRFAPGAAFNATVMPTNLASQALFASAGYEQVGPDLFRSMPN